MKKIVCRGGGDPAIKECLASSNGAEKTVIIAGDYYPEDYPEGDDKRIWGPHYQSFERWIREISPDCHVVSRDTDSQDAIGNIRKSEYLSIEGGYPDRYLNWMINKNIFGLIRDMFLRGDGLREIWSLSAGAISLCREARYFVEDDGDPQMKLDIRPEESVHLTEFERGKKKWFLERRDGLGIVPGTVISPHSSPGKERLFGAAGFFYRSKDAFVFLGDDGVMEIFYEKRGGEYRPVSVRFTGYHKIKLGGLDIDDNAYLNHLRSSSTRKCGFMGRRG